MNEHNHIQELLALGASSDIAPKDKRRLHEHLEQCEACRRISTEFAELAGTLRCLSTPQPRQELVAQVFQLAEMKLARRRVWINDAWIVAPLVIGSWFLAIASWPLLQESGAWLLTRIPFPNGEWVSVLIACSIIGFLTACASALATSGYARLMGRIL
jgi:anti-sigma factor RsiW